MANDKNKQELEQEYLDLVKKHIEEIRYGTVVITIQDGVIVQVDRNEKFRL